MASVTVAKGNRPLGVLVVTEYVKDKFPVEIVQGAATSLSLADVVVSKETTICRMLARAAPEAQLYGETAVQQAEVDHFLEWADNLDCATSFPAALEYLDQKLAGTKCLSGKDVTLADIAVWSVLKGKAAFGELLGNNQCPKNVKRYFEMLGKLKNFRAVANDDTTDGAKSSKKASGPQDKQKGGKGGSKPKGEQAGGEKKVMKEEGKFIDLPGAEMGKVVVRFPPEASGFLHVGHAKAALLNQYYQQLFKGKLIMRFDDTNPAKENAEFEKVILEDLKLLGIKPDVFSHTSDLFDQMITMVEKLLQEGKAYADDTDPETMKKEREERVESANRSNSVEKNMSMWEEMKKGSEAGKKCCLRAKLDMKSDNGCLRDPAIYRCKPEPHIRTGTKYKVYPTYDFACPIVDSVEGVTHALRTTEYHDRDDQYYWFIDAMGLRRPYIWSYSRLNLQNTVMSKRKLTWFVDEGLVDGWSDPRLPTVRGVLRRGMTVQGLKEFVIAQGSSRSVNMMEWDKIWAVNKKVIDPVVPRYTALEKDKVVPVIVKGIKDEVGEGQKHPKDPAVGMKKIYYSSKAFIDGADAETLKVGEKVTFINWGNLIIKTINKNADGSIASLEADPVLDDKDYKKTTKITWLAATAPSTLAVCVQYDHIISKGVLSKEEDFKEFINYNSKSETVMMGDPELASLKKGDMIQLQRRGYYICDSPYEPASPYICRPSPCVLLNIPDGHTKEMPTAGSKHSEPAAAAPSKKEVAQSKKGKAAEKSPQEESAPALGGDAASINQQIIQAGDNVRKLKAEKANKADVTAAVNTLLSLKGQYKQLTGDDWKPGCTPPAPAAMAAESNYAATINDQIIAQGDKVRQLKAAKAEKAVVTEAVNTLLAMKGDYKKVTGSDWKPGCVPPPAAAAAPLPSGPAGDSASSLDQKITEQGNKVRDVKAAKAAKDVIKKEVDVLLALKAEYKKATGADWKPGATPAPAAAAPAPAASSGAADLDNKITQQGNTVRDLKAAKASKDEIKKAVDVLLALKAEYKKATGSDWKPGTTPAPAAAAPAPAAAAPAASSGAADLDNKITQQGNTVRDLKAAKASKDEIKKAVDVLLALKAEYKKATGSDWKPGAAPAPAPAATAAAPAPASSGAADLDNKITQQGNTVRDLKAAKASKDEIKKAVDVLLALKAEYKKATGSDWKPGAAPAPATAAPVASAAGDLDSKITLQGNAVRDLKAAKASKDEIKKAVDVLLALKAEYKKATGSDWKPGATPAPAAATAPAPVANSAAVDLDSKITQQGNTVRDLKAAKASKDEIKKAVDVLLALKAEYKKATGSDWKPGATPAPAPAAAPVADNKIQDSIKEKEDAVKKLKAALAEAEKSLSTVLKQQPAPAPAPAPAAGGGKQKKDKQADKQSKKAQQQGGDKAQGGAEGGREVKKVTRLGVEVKKEDNLADWYSQVIVKGELVEYYNVSGCYVLRPGSFGIWEGITKWFDNAIKEMGFENCYFPMFVSAAALEKEKEHIEDFAPEVAWVTRSGQSELPEPIAIRPTSETVMYPSYSKWVQSHRDLPIKLNQWCSVVRWEFKHPQPFLRTREFLWQEGHSAYATYKEAEKEVYQIIDHYEYIYENLLAIPVVKGRKTDKERFAGGDFTTTVEAYIAASGRGIQAATSHHLGQNFSKMFDISFEDPETKEKMYAYQNSWAITTRSIGVIVMVHGDDKGLVMPPRIAQYQVVVVPCGITASLAESERVKLYNSCDDLVKELQESGIKVKKDYRDNYSPGWKFNYWELKGVPVRIELGPKDLQKQQLVAVRRVDGQKQTIPLAGAGKAVNALLDDIHNVMFAKAKKDLDDNKTIAYTFEDFCAALDKKNVILAPFCGEPKCEEKVKKDSARDAVVEEGAPAMGAKGLCIPFNQPKPISPSDKCVCPGCPNKPTNYTLFGRSY